MKWRLLKLAVYPAFLFVLPGCFVKSYWGHWVKTKTICYSGGRADSETTFPESEFSLSFSLFGTTEVESIDGCNRHIDWKVSDQGDGLLSMTPIRMNCTPFPCQGKGHGVLTVKKGKTTSLDNGTLTWCDSQIISRFTAAEKKPSDDKRFFYDGELLVLTNANSGIDYYCRDYFRKK